MNAVHIIRNAVAEVKALRDAESRDPYLESAVLSVKHYQSVRFQHSYNDLIAGGPFQSAVRFFLNELYGVVDFSGRDAQFARMAGAIERLLPSQVVATAVSLAQLHVLTEQLDHAMANAWRSISTSTTTTERYVIAWRMVGQRDQRQRQLKLVLQLGWEMDRLTRKPGLRKLLKLMRLPASAAGLAQLQSFLETGFDTFASMATHESGTSEFLKLIEIRETRLIVSLFAPGFNIASVMDQGLLPTDSEISQGHQPAG